MSFFLLFMVGSFVSGLLFYQLPLKYMFWLCAAMTLFVAFGYLFLNRI